MNNEKANTKLMLGVVGEVIPIDFEDMGWDAKNIIEQIYVIAFTELVNRPIMSVADWSSRTQNVFLHNKIKTIGHVISLSFEQVNKLVGCGYKTRKQVYEEFNKLGITLKNWDPEKYFYAKSYSKDVRV